MARTVKKLSILLIALAAVFFFRGSRIDVGDAILYYLSQSHAKIAQAGTSENITGFAWSENFGWVSFNSRNCDTDGNGTIESADNRPAGCQAIGTNIPSYGVNIAGNGDVSGFAWSNNLGWAAFERIKVCSTDKTRPCTGASDCLSGTCNFINPPGAPYNTGGGKIASFDSATGQLNGWAYILSLGDDGWLKLRKYSSDSGSSYGVSFNSATGEFSNFAWNGNAVPGIGLGWLSFNCADTSSCAASDYKVKWPTFLAVSITSVDQYGEGVCDSCSCLIVNWSLDSGIAEGFNVFKDTTLVSDSDGLFPDVRSFPHTGLDAGTSYAYRVVAYSGQIYATSSPATGTTSTVCQMDSSLITASSSCPNLIKLGWTAPETACTISHYDVARCKCGVGDPLCSNCPDSDSAHFTQIASGGCHEPSAPRCTDSSFATNEVSNYFRYIIRAHCNSGNVDGDWSQASEKIQPCPKVPTKWIEKKIE